MTRIMYIEDKSGGLIGPARIGRVSFSKTRRTTRWLSLAAAFIVSCASTTERPEADASTMDADADACAASTSSPSDASRVQGFYHMTDPQPGDAFNVLIDQASGTFIYAVSGCDYFHTSRGRFVERNGRRLLLPQDGDPTFLWPEGGSYAKVLMEAEVIVEDQGIRVETGGESQLWAQGGVCSDCGTGDRSPCDDPYLGDECD